MKASVIIPVYNGGRYLATTLESVLAQTYPLHEIIVIDDGSTDSSPDILRSYGDRLRVTRQENQGVAAARNAGLRQVTGDVVNFIDQDDLWPPRRTETLIGALRSNPNALVAIGQVEVLYERSQPPSPVENFGTTLREFLVGSMCVKREVFDLLGHFNTGLGYADDTDFFMRRREANIGTVYVNDVTLQYRLHESNTSLDRNVTSANLLAALRESLQRRRRERGKLQHDERS
jgi:glycosyltransferase involved in cell wall biosynthesis